MNSVIAPLGGGTFSIEDSVKLVGNPTMQAHTDKQHNAYAIGFFRGLGICVSKMKEIYDENKRS
jgi:hypothetical protein